MKETIEEINQIRINHGLKPYKISKRKCLNCEVVFDSWGAHNRICDKCKENIESTQANTYSFDPEANFQYDLTISQILETQTNKGNSWEDFEGRDFYKGGRKEFRE